MTEPTPRRAVVELFSSQGCGNCPKANQNIRTLAERSDVIALTYPVGIWDYLGWDDTFAKPEFSERQKAYVARLKLREPYTPQMVIDGEAQAGGLQAEKVDRLVVQALAGQAGELPEQPAFRRVC